MMKEGNNGKGGINGRKRTVVLDQVVVHFGRWCVGKDGAEDGACDYREGTADLIGARRKGVSM